MTQLNQEIERKFLIKHIPQNLNDYPHSEIIQGYVIVSQDETELRLRRKANKFYQTIKKGIGIRRTEIDIELNEDQFKKLWFLTEKRRIEKTRYEIAYNQNIIELDLYDGNLTGLVTAEVEFSSLNDASQFNAPKWFGKEITQDSRYMNRNLAIYGIPDN